jgi:hypothetical protein
MLGNRTTTTVNPAAPTASKAMNTKTRFGTGGRRFCLRRKFKSVVGIGSWRP